MTGPTAGVVAAAEVAQSTTEVEVTSGSGFQQILTLTVPNEDHEAYFVSVTLKARGKTSSLTGWLSCRVVVDGIPYPDTYGLYYGIDAETTYPLGFAPVLTFNIPNNVKGKTISLECVKLALVNYYVKDASMKGWGQSAHAHR